MSEKILDQYWEKKKAAVKEILLDIAMVEQMAWREAASSVKMMDELMELKWA